MTYVRVPNAYTSVSKNVPTTETGVKANSKSTEIRIQPQEYWLVDNKDLNGPGPGGSYPFFSNHSLGVHDRNCAEYNKRTGLPRFSIPTPRLGQTICNRPELEGLRNTFEAGTGYLTEKQTGKSNFKIRSAEIKKGNIAKEPLGAFDPIPPSRARAATKLAL